MTPAFAASPGREGLSHLQLALGLTVCRTLARLLGGEVELVETGPGGTLFALRLPAAPDQRATEVLAIA